MLKFLISDKIMIEPLFFEMDEEDEDDEEEEENED